MLDYLTIKAWIRLQGQIHVFPGELVHQLLLFRLLEWRCHSGLCSFIRLMSGLNHVLNDDSRKCTTWWCLTRVLHHM